mmetsp:Transcript_34261/g.118047  ORF Transcript_34261/g.118047 Transcript_34261/m.118047 type:complete len:221 (+) Transcript_34261:744-1406(+)
MPTVFPDASNKEPPGPGGLLALWDLDRVARNERELAFALSFKVETRPEHAPRNRRGGLGGAVRGLGRGVRDRCSVRGGRRIRGHRRVGGGCGVRSGRGVRGLRGVRSGRPCGRRVVTAEDQRLFGVAKFVVVVLLLVKNAAEAAAARAGGFPRVEVRGDASADARPRRRGVGGRLVGGSGRLWRRGGGLVLQRARRVDSRGNGRLRRRLCPRRRVRGRGA